MVRLKFWEGRSLRGEGFERESSGSIPIGDAENMNRRFASSAAL